jgi:hypothetical protein
LAAALVDYNTAPGDGPVLVSRKARPFALNVASPHRQTLLPEYTTCSGRLTSNKATAARYYFSDTPPFGQITCQDDGASGRVGKPKYQYVWDFGVWGGDDDKSIFDTFSLDASNVLHWENGCLHDKKCCARGGGWLISCSAYSDFYYKAKFILREDDGGAQVMSFWGGYTTQDYIPVTLTADFAV